MASGFGAGAADGVSSDVRVAAAAAAGHDHVSDPLGAGDAGRKGEVHCAGYGGRNPPGLSDEQD